MNEILGAIFFVIGIIVLAWLWYIPRNQYTDDDGTIQTTLKDYEKR
ncbi:MAG: hypothetical protein Q7J10_05610 [Methanosarcinaceae archaeon]|nr:hypothetical protein [Methanosarcinaceae archaeon]